MHQLVRSQDMRRGYASARGANIERLGQLHKFGSREVGGAQKDRYLQPDSRRAAGWGIVQALAFLQKLGFHTVSHSTRELVRSEAFRMPHSKLFMPCKLQSHIPLMEWMYVTSLAMLSSVRVCLVRFPNCANETPFPLTVDGAFASIAWGNGKHLPLLPGAPFE